jgi:signal transduction histidine kinase
MDPKQHIVLFVDDEHASRVVFEQSFGKRFRVKCVDAAPKALDILKAEPVAVLVTDQRMPEMSGDELLERAKVLSPDTVRIVVTAYSDLEPILHAVNAGLVVRYIIKPWDRAELEQILRWALEVYEVGRTNSAVQLRLIQTERMLTLGHVTATVIHDLRQPLASISVNVNELRLLAERIQPLLTKLGGAAEQPELDRGERRRLRELAHDFPELAGDVLSATTYMQEVLRQLAQFRDREFHQTEPSNVDPVPLVRQAIAMCRHEAETLSCAVVNDLPAALPRVRATAVQVLQIVINVLRNAQQAVGRKTERGGKVTLTCAELERELRFAVRDDGPGMSAEVQAKLGTFFFTTRPEGTGLGIAQVRRLLGSLGGTLTIESTVGKGTTATFTIPKST